MDFKSQKQTAGDGAQQNQGNVVVVNNYNGTSAEELSAVLLKQGLFVREQCTEVANQVIDKKLKEFEKRMMTTFIKDESLLNSYKEPNFQLLSREAQLSAIVSERDSDYDLLTQLLVCHVKKGKDLKNIELKKIIENTKIVLEQGIKNKGTTIHSFSSLGVEGHNQDSLLVHTKEGLPCTVCGTIIKKIKVNGRGTYYCPKCQR